MLDELKDEKEELIAKRAGLKAEMKSMPDSDPQKDYVYSKIRKIDQDLQTEFFKILEERGEEPPKLEQVKGGKVEDDIIMKEYRETIKQEEARIKQIKDEYFEGDKEFQATERAIQEREAQQKKEEKEQAAAESSKISSGAVSGSESESESEFQSKIRGGRVNN